MNFFSNDRNSNRRWLGSLSLGAMSALSLAASHCVAAILPMTAFTPDPTPGSYDNTTIVTSYTTSGSAGTVSNLSHAVLAWGRFDRLGTTGAEISNSWGSAGVEIDGAASVLNLDVSTGVLNAGDTTDSNQIEVARDGTETVKDTPGGGGSMYYLFSQVIPVGLAGTGNDFFLFENGGNDAISVFPIDFDGNRIGDLSLSINSSTDWGTFSNVYSRLNDGSSAVALSDLGGVAFDIEDFMGTTGDISTLHGIEITGTAGIDLLVVGVNKTLAPLPVPGDVDGDGFVNTADFNIINGNMFKTVTSRLQGDLNGDFVVDFADYRQWKDAPHTNPGSGSGSGANVPEPASLSLIGIGLLLSLFARLRFQSSKSA